MGLMGSIEERINEFGRGGGQAPDRRQACDGPHLSHAIRRLGERASAHARSPDLVPAPEARWRAPDRQIDALIRGALVATGVFTVVGLVVGALHSTCRMAFDARNGA